MYSNCIRIRASFPDNDIGSPENHPFYNISDYLRRNHQRSRSLQPWQITESAQTTSRRRLLCRKETKSSSSQHHRFCIIQAVNCSLQLSFSPAFSYNSNAGRLEIFDNNFDYAAASAHFEILMGVRKPKYYYVLLQQCAILVYDYYYKLLHNYKDDNKVLLLHASRTFLLLLVQTLRGKFHAMVLLSKFPEGRYLCKLLLNDSQTAGV